MAKKFLENADSTRKSLDDLKKITSAATFDQAEIPHTLLVNEIEYHQDILHMRHSVERIINNNDVVKLVEMEGLIAFAALLLNTTKNNLDFDSRLGASATERPFAFDHNDPTKVSDQLKNHAAAFKGLKKRLNTLSRTIGSHTGDELFQQYLHPEDLQKLLEIAKLPQEERTAKFAELWSQRDDVELTSSTPRINRAQEAKGHVEAVLQNYLERNRPETAK